MFESIVQVLLWTAAAFLACGVIFAVPFLTSGISQIDPEARGSGLGFRVIIFPGVVAFWPLLLKRWISGVEEPPVERNPHR